MKWSCSDIKELPKVANELIAQFPECKLIAFYGEMGAGKTTFIKAICASLGIEEEVSSPTFALVNEYNSATELVVYHFDFYRITDVSEAYDMGFEEYIDSGNYCLIEWPEMVEEFIDSEFLKVRIDSNGIKRTISIV
ncbi:MAG: tRNA (adenosine(37)-N6)-threonylcarbamoyltransferase complex ATPase subunit type 1 TsaE [Flavobacteriales bacterium]|nr:tRNA (adenosine(37)-N6)-threonylcarbamoyltransferase complex ATPase subunit type 1 TsaE [Flavobacteriales bacterium]